MGFILQQYNPNITDEKNKKLYILKPYIYIIGPKRLFNDFLCEYLAKENIINYTCKIYDTLPSVEILDQALFNLLIFDCLDSNITFTKNRINNHLAKSRAHFYKVLINANKKEYTKEKDCDRDVLRIFYDHDTLEDFKKGIQAILKGEIWRPDKKNQHNDNIENDKTYQNDSNSDSEYSLTQREREILRLIALGKRNNDIADSLHISLCTVKTHAYNIYKKINAPNRTQAALWATKNLSV